MLTLLDRIGRDKTISDNELHLFVNDVFVSVVDAWSKRFAEGKTDKTTLGECENAATYIIDMSNTLISVSLSDYANDCNESTYQLTDGSLRKMSKYLSIIMYKNNDVVFNEAFAFLFNISFHGCIISAQKHRKMVEEEIAAKKNIKN